MNPTKTEELSTFFLKSPNIKTFFTSSQYLEKNSAEIIESKVKLENLKVHEGYYDATIGARALCSLLHKLYEHGCYERLHFQFTQFNQDYCDEIASLHGLESLCALLISHFNKCDLSGLTSLKNLNLQRIAIGGINTEPTAKALVNLRCLSVNAAKFDDVLTREYI